MNKSEDTIPEGGLMDPKDETSKKSMAHPAWRAVTIGGVSGIMLGAVPVGLGAGAGQDVTEPDESGEDAVAAGEPEAGPLIQEPAAEAPETNYDDMSFGQAFASARAELGPGEVFEWRGSLFTTDTREEWEAAHPPVNDDDDVIVAEEDDDVAVEVLGSGQDDYDGVVFNIDGHDYDDDVIVPEVDEEDDVQLVDVDVVPTDEGAVLVGTLSVNGDEALVVDVNGDGTFDALISDFNEDGVITEDEVVNIQEMELGLNDFAQDDMGYDPDPSAGMDF